jgi:hypothetical protein
VALSQKDAVEAARSILNGPAVAEKRRLDPIALALRSDIRPAVNLPSGVAPMLRELALKARTNYLPLVLDVLAQTLIVDGYRSLDGENAAVWQTWQANRLDARQTGVHRGALAYGVSYATVLPSDGGRAAIRGVSARKLTAVYEDPVEDDWPILALRHDGDLLRLYDETSVYFLGRQQPPGSSIEFVERRDHDLGVPPVIRFRDRMLLDEDQQQGVIEPLLSLQGRVDETVFGLLIAQFYAAFKQRVVIGWVPKSEEEQLRASASSLWTFADENVKVTSLEETDLTRYLDSKDSGVGDMATIAQVPKQNLGVGAVANMSAEALAAMEASKDRKVAEIETSLGESWEQTLRLAARVEGDVESAEDDTAEVRWKDSSARSFAQMVDGLGKIAQMLQVPPQALWERIPGVTQTDVERWKQMAAEADAIGGLTALLDSQTAGL